MGDWEGVLFTSSSPGHLRSTLFSLSCLPFPRYQEHLLSRGVWAEVASCLLGGQLMGQPPSLVARAHGQALQVPAVLLLHTAVSCSSSTLRNHML